MKTEFFAEIEIENTIELNATTFNKVYHMYQKPILNWINMQVHNMFVAEDICSITFTKLYNSMDIYNPKRSKLSSWIMTLAGNEIKNYVRSKSYKKSQVTTSTAAFTNENGDEIFEIGTYENKPSDLIEGKQIKQQVNFAMSQLNETAQNCIALRYMQGKEYSEIADILGISLSNVKVTINRARAIMQENLKSTYASL